jgi:hypothetical protein
MKTDDIDVVIKELCRIGARAVCRYVEVTDLPPGDMPESFILAFIFDRLGNELKMTLESNFFKLLEWNMSSKTGRHSKPSIKDIRALASAANRGAQRVDLVIFADPHRPKSEQDILALVEFKSGWISGGGTDIPPGTSDREKLLLLLKHIDTSRYGVVCGWTAKPQYQRNEARKVGDRWFEEPFDIHGTPYFFCARVFGVNGNQPPTAA